MASNRPAHSNGYAKPRSHRHIWLTLALLLLALSCMGMVATSVTDQHGTVRNGDPVSLNSTAVAASVPAERAPAGHPFFSESATMALFGTALLSVAALMHRRRA